MSGSTSNGPSGVPAYSHIVVVMEENHSYNEIIGNPSAPYINGTLVPGGALMSNYFAITHPSEPNYFALYAGSTFGVTDDNFHAESDPTLDTVLNGRGKSFVGYVEQPIDQNHTPWEYFPEGASVEKDISSFTAGNFAALPTVSFVIPNVNDDMHNGTIQQGDTWLQNNINAYAQWAKSNNSLLVVTWDEDDGTQNNQVPAILYGADITPGVYNTLYNHYNLLSTIATAEGVTGPNNAATVSPITDIYNNTPTCFVSGTRILTERGEIAVEDLREGDRVVTVEDEGQAVRQVRWIGHRQIDLAIHPDPEMMSPIRIRCDAIGENIPHRDLLVSADHAIFIDGKLIPARMLVNGTTIVKETSARKVLYFHIELDQHSVLFAEGLTAESYLETGNRTFFTNGGLPPAMHAELNIGSGLNAYARYGYAPLAVSELEVRPVWHRLSARAGALGCPVVLPNTTNDAALRLVVDGRAFRPIVIKDDWYVFPLPCGAGSVQLASRSASPTASRPWLDDRRRLGVCVQRIFLQTYSRVAEIPIDHPGLRRGWHAAERQGDRPCRWTDGDAAFPLPATASEGGVLKVRVAGAASYPLEMPVRAA